MNQIRLDVPLARWSPLGIGGSPPPSPSGFSWDYLDLLDGEGSGVVLIWAKGLPFVPGTVGAGRAGRPIAPDSEPSVSLSVYERGRCTAWSLHVLDPAEVHGARFGSTEFRGTPGAMDVRVDLPIPGGPRLVGRIVTEGRPVRLAPRGDAVHRWAPQALGHGRASLSCGPWSLDLEGRAYHDRNASAVGLEALGIARWFWGRIPHAGGDRIHYVLEPRIAEHGLQGFTVDVTLDGHAEVREVDVRTGPERRGRWGVRAPAWLELDGVRVEHVHALEDGPYYQRWAIRGAGPEGTHAGVGEVVAVDRMDRGPTAPLTRMAVHRPRGASPFLPLFCGPTSGRLARLVRAWSGR